MTDPNLRAMTKDIAKEMTTESYIANGWWALVSAAHASSVVFELGLNNNRGPALFVSSLLKPADNYWARAWVFALAWLMTDGVEPSAIFNHSSPRRDESLDDQFKLAYRENLESPQERMLTLTEFTLRAEAPIGTLTAVRAAQIDLDRTRREVRVVELERRRGNR
jgi:hypothetical protein